MPDVVAAAIERARNARANGRLQSALTEYERAASAAKSEGLTTEFIVALEGIGQIERDLGDLESACAKYHQAAEECRGANEPMRLAHALRHIADIELERGRGESAAGPASEAVEISRQQPDIPPLELANTLRVWALVQEAEGDMTGATCTWREALVLYEAQGIEAGVRECEVRIGG